MIEVVSVKRISVTIVLLCIFTLNSTKLQNLFGNLGGISKKFFCQSKITPSPWFYSQSKITPSPWFFSESKITPSPWFFSQSKITQSLFVSLLTKLHFRPLMLVAQQN